jgi:DNA-binding transcriptional LysR family regulator
MFVRYYRTMLGPRDLPLLGVFAAVVRKGSFTAAARDLGVSKSVVSDRVRTLEDRLDVRLLERSTRRLRPTQVGEEVLSVALGVLDATGEVERIVENHRDAPVGTLRVGTTHDLAPRLVVPVAARIAARHPNVTVEIVADDAQHDLIAAGFDVGVRLGTPRSSGYGFRRLGVVPEIVTAAPELAARRAVSRPSDLAEAPWTRHTLLPRADVIELRGPRGEREKVAVRVRAGANTGDGVRGLVRGGVGFGLLPMHLAADDLASGALVQVCKGWVARQISIFAVVPSARRQPRRTELFLAALKEAIVGERLLSGASRRPA